MDNGKGEIQMMKGLFHTSITVSNLERSIAFYRDILGLELLYTRESSGEGLSKGVGVENAHLKIAMFRVGDDFLELIEYVAPKCVPKGLRPCDIGSMHVAFHVIDIGEMEQRLTKHGYHFNAPPRRITEGPMKGWIWAYFKDPDGAQLELVETRD
jgi:catechol 2,3-dioxygenase-like lactoylglutathione lyase family enzyme